MRRKDREKDEDFAIEVLKKCMYATLATTQPDGCPYCIPINPAVEGKSVYFHCAMQGKKLDNISADSRVCLSAVSSARPVQDKFTMEYDSAVAFGTAHIVCSDEERIKALRLICEKFAPQNMADFESAVERSLYRTCIVRVDIDRITGKQKRLNKT